MNEMMMERKRRATFRELAKEFNLTPRQVAYARAAGVRNAPDFYSYLSTAPGKAAELGMDTPGISAQLLREASVAALLSGSMNIDRDTVGALGATAPKGAAFQIGDVAPELSEKEIARFSAFEPGPMSQEDSIEVRTCGPWPIRNQGNRGTCVSFSTTAIYELYRCAQGKAWEDLSEQFLYWAVKHHHLDGYPNEDGTWHRCTVAALRQFGICKESDWAYNGSEVNPVSDHPPPSAAEAIADALRTSVPVATPYNTTSGKAAQVLQKLKDHSGVAIALPVFKSPTGEGNNWTTPTARSFGEVMNPVSGWVADGGHAVCCVGFQPDPEEVLGGHFIIRNSWGTQYFGANLPEVDYYGPEPGYGQVSASYVDRYLWEDCVF